MVCRGHERASRPAPDAPGGLLVGSCATAETWRGRDRSHVDVALEPTPRRRDGARGIRRLGPSAPGLRWALRTRALCSLPERVPDTGAAHATCCAVGEATRGHNAASCGLFSRVVPSVFFCTVSLLRRALFSAVSRARFRALAMSRAESLRRLAAHLSSLATLEAAVAHVWALLEAPPERVVPIPATGPAPRLAHLPPRSRPRSPLPKAAHSRPCGSILLNQSCSTGLSVELSRGPA